MPWQLLAWGVVLAVSTPALAEHRAALLIGNSAYPGAELATPSKSVALLAGEFRKRGVSVTVVENLDTAAMKEVVGKFCKSVPTGGTAIVYFSGYALYGEQNERNDNYFLPLDGNPGKSWDVARSPLGVKAALSTLSSQSGAVRYVVIVDAQGRHPKQSTEEDLSLRMLSQLPPDSVVAFSAAADETETSPAEESPFAHKFARQLSQANHGFLQCLRESADLCKTSIAQPELLNHAASTSVSSVDRFERGRSAGEEWVNRYGMVFCWCPPGTAHQGSPPDAKLRRADEAPIEVTFREGFWISKYEVTQQQMKSVVGRTFYLSPDSSPLQPMVRFDRESIRQKLLEPLNRREHEARSLSADWVYALPSETEWEYAARAGTSTPFYFGENINELPRHANFADKTLLHDPAGLHAYAHPRLDDGIARLDRVGRYQANPWGLHDMYGSVWEWCETGYVADRSGDKQASGAGPHGSTTPTKLGFVARGGSWASPADYCRSAFRQHFEPKLKADFVGYRLVIRKQRD